MVKQYQDLVVWQKAMAVVTEVYKTTAAFPDNEKFGLTSQMRRAAVSIPSNIAEGQGRSLLENSNNFWDMLAGHCMNWKHSC